MVRKFHWAVVATAVVVLSGCGGEEGGGGNGGSGGGDSSARSTENFSENNVTLQSQTFTLPSEIGETRAFAQTRTTTDPENCTYISDNYSANGTCLTPSQVTGRAYQVHLHKEYSSVGGGTRLLGESESDEEAGAIIVGADFDLADPSALVTNNTLWEQYSAREQYDSVAVTTEYYKVQFPLTYNSGATTQWVTMFLARYGQPFASSAAITNALANCGLIEDNLQQSRYQNADVLTGMTFNRGDYLFCVKDSEDAVCAADDFQWLDTSDNSLVSTRPSVPKSAHYLANNPIECINEGEDRINFDFGPFGLYASLATDQQFKLWSDFSHGEMSQQWPETNYPLEDMNIGPAEDEGWVSPYNIYYYQDCSSGTCSSTTAGAELDVTLDFDVEEMLLVADMNATSVASQTNIGDILVNVHTKTQWAFDQKSINLVEGYDANDMTAMSVEPTITVSRDIDNPPEGAIFYCPAEGCPDAEE